MSTAIAEVVEFIGELFGSLSSLVERIAVVQRITVTALTALGYLTSSQTSTKSTRHDQTRASVVPVLRPSLSKVETVGDAYIAGQVRPHESCVHHVFIFRCSVSS